MMNEIWQRLVVRGLKKPKLWPCYPWLIFGMGMLFQVAYDNNRPVLQLDEMDVQSGVIVNAFTSGRAGKPWLVIQQGDQTFKYAGGKVLELKKYIGKPATVWSEPHFFILSGYEHETRQVQVDGQLIEDYEKDIRKNIEALNEGNSKYMFYIFPILMIVIPLLLLWKLNAIPNEKTEEKG